MTMPVFLKRFHKQIKTFFQTGEQFMKPPFCQLFHFSNGLLALPPANSSIECMLRQDTHLIMPPIFLELEGHRDWGLAALAKDWATWKCQRNRIPTVSKVGVMSSFRFQQLVNPSIGNQLGSYFGLLMHTSSVVYNPGPRESYCGYTWQDFHAIRSYAGSQVLIGLEPLFRPTNLAKATPEKMGAIFLLLFGTVLAVLYRHQMGDDVKTVSTRL